MKILKSLCFFATILNFSIQAYFYEQRTALKQLAAMGVLGLFFVLILVSFILGLDRYSREKFKGFVPFLICSIGLIISFVGGIALGNAIKESRFQKNLPRFNEVVTLIQTGKLKPAPPNRSILLPPTYSDLTATAFVYTNVDGTNIEFLTENGFPVKHSGYLHVSSGRIDSSHTLQNWPIHFRINTNWFYISN